MRHLIEPSFDDLYALGVADDNLLCCGGKTKEFVLSYIRQTLNTGASCFVYTKTLEKHDIRDLSRAAKELGYKVAFFSRIKVNLHAWFLGPRFSWSNNLSDLFGMREKKTLAFYYASSSVDDRDIPHKVINAFSECAPTKRGVAQSVRIKMVLEDWNGWDGLEKMENMYTIPPISPILVSKAQVQLLATTKRLSQLPCVGVPRWGTLSLNHKLFPGLLYTGQTSKSEEDAVRIKDYCRTIYTGDEAHNIAKTALSLAANPNVIYGGVSDLSEETAYKCLSELDPAVPWCILRKN